MNYAKGVVGGVVEDTCADFVDPIGKPEPENEVPEKDVTYTKTTIIRRPVVIEECVIERPVIVDECVVERPVVVDECVIERPVVVDECVAVNESDDDYRRL